MVIQARTSKEKERKKKSEKERQKELFFSSRCTQLGAKQTIRREKKDRRRIASSCRQMFAYVSPFHANLSYVDEKLLTTSLVPIRWLGRKVSL